LQLKIAKRREGTNIRQTPFCVGINSDDFVFKTAKPAFYPAKFWLKYSLLPEFWGKKATFFGYGIVSYE
jgi:hypothetical protein